MPQARFQLTYADVEAAAQANRRLAGLENPIESRIGAWLLSSFIFMIFELLLSPLIEGHANPLFRYGFVPLVGTSPIFFLWKFTTSRPALAAFRDNTEARDPQDIAWDSVGVSVRPPGAAAIAWPRCFKPLGSGRRPEAVAEIPWTRFVKWSEADKAMLLNTTGGTYLLLPGRALTQADRDDIRDHLTRAGVRQAGRMWWRRNDH